MARKKQEVVSQWWNPEKAGEDISGTFAGYTVSEPHGKIKKPMLVLHLKTKTETRLITCTTILLNSLRPFGKKGFKGILRIVYGGMKAGGQGKVKLYDVFLDGKKINADFGAPVNAEYEKEFFG